MTDLDAVHGPVLQRHRQHPQTVHYWGAPGDPPAGTLAPCGHIFGADTTPSLPGDVRCVVCVVCVDLARQP